MDNKDERLEGLGKTYRGIITKLSNSELGSMIEMMDNEGKPKVLDVAGEERTRIDEILYVFKEYIDNHRYFDIFSSKKFAYYYINRAGEHEQFTTVNEVLGCILSELYNDAKDSVNSVTAGFTVDEANSFTELIKPYFDRITNNGYCYDYLRSFISKQREEFDDNNA